VEGVVRRGWCTRLWVGRRGRSRRGGVRGAADRLRFFFMTAVSEGVCAEAAGVPVIERAGWSFCLAHVRAAVRRNWRGLGASWDGIESVVRESTARRGLWGQRCLSADDLAQAGGARRESSGPRLGAVGGLGR
jgi:hypothetical protein